MITELQRRRNAWAIRLRHYGADDPRTIEAARAVELARLDAARAEVARCEARVVALLTPR